MKTFVVVTHFGNPLAVIKADSIEEAEKERKERYDIFYCKCVELFISGETEDGVKAAVDASEGMAHKVLNEGYMPEFINEGEQNEKD